jgi:hypothetical protein
VAQFTRHRPIRVIFGDIRERRRRHQPVAILGQQQLGDEAIRGLSQ